MPTIRCLSGPMVVGGKFLYERETREVTDRQLADVRKRYTHGEFEVIGPLPTSPVDAAALKPSTGEEMPSLPLESAGSSTLPPLPIPQKAGGTFGGEGYQPSPQPSPIGEGVADQLVGEEVTDEHSVLDTESALAKRGGRAKRRA